MEVILARQSVIIKCTLNASILMGNYEFYYAGGLLCHLAGQIPQQAPVPKELEAFISPLLTGYEPKNEKESYLLKLLKEYKVQEAFDSQMPELLKMGLYEKQIWVQHPIVDMV